MLKPQKGGYVGGGGSGRMKGMNAEPHYEWLHTDEHNVDTFERAAGTQLEPPDPFE